MIEIRRPTRWIPFSHFSEEDADEPGLDFAFSCKLLSGRGTGSSVLLGGHPHLLGGMTRSHSFRDRSFRTRSSALGKYLAKGTVPNL